MPLYWYKAVDAEGRTLSGDMDCPNDTDLETRLAKLGLELVRAKEVKPRVQLFGRKKISRQEMITFCFQMEQLAAAGVPILDGLVDLRDSLEEGALRTMVADLVESIQGGKQLSEAVARHPQAFSPVMTSLIQAGEVSGELQKVFVKLTQSLKWEDELISQTKKLLAYPAFAGTVVLSVALFLLLYLVPQLATFIKSMSKELPLPTLIMLKLSDFLRNYWYTLPIGVAGLVASFVSYARSSPQARYRIDRWKLDTWMVGPILKKIALARFTGFFSMMFAAGVTVLEALRVGEKVAGNLVIEEAIRKTRDAILDGRTISDGFQSTGMFPPLVLRMVRIGESTGDLDKALDNVNYFYDREVREDIAKVEAIIEPAMTVILGVVLGSIMFAVLGPIYDVVSKIKF
ncbi:MAG TPA: type II secretion system F family protein [Rhodocyclaceae bacterium]|nr:type II secretion system F family protein [Rhodocyclaceae bacterium]